MANEKRLIDVNDIYSLFNQNGIARLHVTDIDSIPRVDAVEVIRCKDCKHHRDKNEQEQQYLAEDTLICTSQDATEDCWNAVWPNHFCSCGERRGGDSNG